MIVSLYIKTSKYQNISSSLVSEFKERVVSDLGTFEAGLCCLDTINDLGGAYDYADTFNRIELFEDEKISVTSSIQNINDISKIFTDYSQSFTIPASDNNNEIFKHWYENAIDNGFDQRIRYDGFIKIDTQTFRVGKWQLEGASVKNNRIENYKITFYGDLKSLTDKFGDDKLKDVETLNNYTIQYTGANVQSAIQSFNGNNVAFPLISSERVWQYGSGSENIGNSAHPIVYTELFPAVKVKRIFDAIASKYNVFFDGSFLSNELFTDAYCWFKNKEIFSNYAEPQKINFTTTQSDGSFNINAVNDTITANYFSEQFFLDSYAQLVITFPSTTNYNLKVFKYGAEYTSLQGSGTNFGFTIDESVGVGVYEFYLQTSGSTSYTYTLNTYYFDSEPGSPNIWQNSLSVSGGGTLSSNLDLTALAPDIKVSDFFSGILKMFNLTAYSIDGINFTLEQLENWYYLGNIKDYSEYCISDFEYNRIKPYKKINFEYEKSESILNRNFGDTNLREYGSLSSTFNNDGSDYTIKLPFENILFSKFTGTNLQVAYSLKTDLQKYIPKPVILYFIKNDSQTVYFNNGSSTVNLNTIANFGQDNIANGQINTLNWGVEISSYYLNPINKSLFNNYYLAYLNNLYSLKSRMVKVKMRLPYSELLQLKLNDRIIIRNKRYVINQYTTDLTTFESDFELIQDFRSLTFNNTSSRVIESESPLLTFFTTSKEPLTWSILSDDDSMIFEIIDYNDRVTVKTNDNTSGLPKIASIISNQNDVIIIEQDA